MASFKHLFLLATLIASTQASVTQTQFELDGNAKVDNLNKLDWGNSGPVWTGIVEDPAGVGIFTGGGSKDTRDITQWKHTSGSVPDKDEITHAYAKFLDSATPIIYFGADRFDNNGDASIGFWFFQDNVRALADGTFSGKHQNGDMLVVADFGSSSEIIVFLWQDGQLVQYLDDTTARCQDAVDMDVCFMANEAVVESPWSYTPKFGQADWFPVESFVEGGIDLNAIFGSDIPCFTSFLAETRSSSSPTAQLKDFVAGSFPLCGISVEQVCDSSVLHSRYVTVSSTITVTNTGIATVTDVSVTVEGKVVGTTASLAKGEQFTVTMSMNSSSLEAEFPAASATASAGSGSVLTADAPSAVCPVPTPSPQMNAFKECDVSIESVGSVLAVMKSVAGYCCNTGDVALDSVTVTDDHGTVDTADDTTQQLGSLEPGHCMEWEDSYFPSAWTDANYSLSDTVVCQGSPAFQLPAVQAEAEATCALCA